MRTVALPGLREHQERDLVLIQAEKVVVVGRPAVVEVQAPTAESPSLRDDELNDEAY